MKGKFTPFNDYVQVVELSAIFESETTSEPRDTISIPPELRKSDSSFTQYIPVWVQLHGHGYESPRTLVYVDQCKLIDLDTPDGPVTIVRRDAILGSYESSQS